MVMRVDEPRDDELARGVEKFDPIVGLDTLCDALDGPAADQKIGGLRLVYVAVVVIDAAPADQIARGSGVSGHR